MTSHFINNKSITSSIVTSGDSMLYFVHKKFPNVYADLVKEQLLQLDASHGVPLQHSLLLFVMRDFLIRDPVTLSHRPFEQAIEREYLQPLIFLKSSSYSVKIMKIQ